MESWAFESEPSPTGTLHRCCHPLSRIPRIVPGYNLGSEVAEKRRYCATLVWNNTWTKPMKHFSASIEATPKFQPITEASADLVTTLIGQNFSLASIESKKSFMGSDPGYISTSQ